MELTKDVRDRIFSAAEALYEQSGRGENLPTVDAVRKTAKVNMNDASTGMKEWRRARMAQVTTLAVQVPETIQKVSSAALVAMWQEAQELANESLRAAQAGWDTERAEAATLSKQMADAFEAQVVELELAQAEIERLSSELNKSRLNMAIAVAGSERADARATEIERRADELRKELDRGHQELEKSDAERDLARKELGQVREDGAALRGQLEAMKEQNDKLIQSMRISKS